MSPQSLHRQVGQLAIVGFTGPTISPELRSLSREFGLGGVILFDRNIETPEQVGELVRDLQEALGSEVPLWISVDQEGGRVARLRRPFTEWPAMATLGRSDDEKLAARFARALAQELRAVGISLDFAPVLDVHTNPRNPVIGDRALAERADAVARLGVTIIKALQENGIAACGKHFPGHGDTSTDSHHELPLVEHPPDRLREVELVPFQAAIAAGVASIMTAHLLVPAWDEQRPASLSPLIVTDILRHELKFDGLIVTDDLDMRGCAAQYTLPEAAVAALSAGSDVLLMCAPNPDRQYAALEAVVHAVENQALGYTQIDDALARHRRLKARFINPAWRPLPARRLRAMLGGEEHQAIAHEMRSHG